MKLYICDEQKLTKHTLPTEVQESVLIQYVANNSKRTFNLNIESEEDSWVLKSNGLVNVVQNGSIVQNAKLTNYASYRLEMFGEKSVKFLYCLPQYSEQYTDLSIWNVNGISIGSDPSCNICYRDELMLAQHIVIQKDENGTLLTASANNVFINGYAITQTYLKPGDIIFVSGLRLIYMGNFIRINNPNGMVSVNGLEYYSNLVKSDYTEYDKTDNDFDIDLYGENDYFYHIPRIMNGYGEEKITIEAPPEAEKEQHTPIIMALGSSLTMAASSFMMGFSVVNGLSSGNRTIKDVLPQIVMCVAMIIGTLIMPRIARAYTNKQIRKREKIRKQKYLEYLDKNNAKIHEILETQSRVLKYNYPSQTDCINFIINGNKRLWERQFGDNDFLSLSVGIGNARSKLSVDAPEKGFQIDEDDLKEALYKVVDQSKTLVDVPVVYSLIERRLSAIISNHTYKYTYINSLITQFVATHSATDLKLVFFVENKSQFEYVKYLPHIWSEDKKTRFFASDVKDVKKCCEVLEKEVKERKEVIDPSGNKKEYDKDCYKTFSSYYLIVTDMYKSIKDINFINEQLNSSYNIGFSFLFIENTMDSLPPQCKTFTFFKEDECYIAEPGEEYSKSRNFSVPQLINIDMNYVASKLLNIPIAAKAGAKELPKSLTFLEMYNVSKIEQLNILNRWKTNNPVQNLNTPIGVHTDGDLFMLNLHEKAHGPHGLIAGSTGSGKSEFIITFVLSMAINFHPNEVQFVLIDYKGGGLAGAFENRETGISLPHLAGTITNLDTAEMNRTLVSINSELKRRQAKFNTERDRLGEGTIDIYKYQKLYREGKITDPISHLFIISDEFAELKSQQPDFMDELISTARIGRSLGVHLILATQKPTGVVNDQIWANSKFKICLKVQDRGDSMEMIKRPEAASIKETGRFYLQVGYDEYFDIGQSGWSGAEYIPSDRVIKKVDNSVNYIDSTGEVIMTLEDDAPEVNTDNKEKLGDQLTNIVKYIVDISKKQNIKTEKLWLSSIPDVIQLDGLISKYDYKPESYVINPAIGEYDNPSAQKQGLLTINLTDLSNLLVFGMAGSGKENLITTLIYNTCVTHTPEEVNFYIMDYGAETLRIFSKYPHVGSVITADEADSLLDILVMIDREADKRKALFVEYGGTYKNYIKESGEKLPMIIVVINYYEVFLESNQKLADALTGLIREGSKYGISFIITTSVNNSMNQRMQQLFLNKAVLQQPDDGAYRSTFNAPKGLIPKKYFGRGIALVDGSYYEFQTAYICEKDGVNKLIRKTAEELNEKYQTRARQVRRLPDIVKLDEMLSMEISVNGVPIGLDATDVEPYNYDLTKGATHLVLAKTVSTKTAFANCLVNELTKMENAEISVIDPINMIKDIDGITMYRDNFPAALSEIISGFNKESEDNVYRVYVVAAFSKFINDIDEQYKSYIESLMTNINKFSRSKLIVFDSYERFKNLQTENWFDEAIDFNNVIWLDEGVNEQSLVTFDTLTEDEMNTNFENVAFIKQNSVSKVIKYVTDGQEGQ